MSSGDAPGDGRLLGSLRDLVRGGLRRRGGTDDAGRVVEVRGATATQRGDLATRLARDNDRPVFRLTADDLVAPPHDRLAAVLRLLDAAQVAGAIPLVDAADHLAFDAAAVVALEERLGEFPGLVVLSTSGPSALKGLVDEVIQPG